jgi:hypothetical protein
MEQVQTQIQSQPHLANPQLESVDIGEIMSEYSKTTSIMNNQFGNQQLSVKEHCKMFIANLRDVHSPISDLVGMDSPNSSYSNQLNSNKINNLNNPNDSPQLSILSSPHSSVSATIHNSAVFNQQMLRQQIQQFRNGSSNDPSSHQSNPAAVASCPFFEPHYWRYVKKIFYRACRS